MTGRLALFANDKRAHDKAPDAKGVGEIDGVKVEAAAWWRTSRDGQEYLSVAISLPRERMDAQPRPPSPPPGSSQATTAAAADSADEIPF
jgi:uncharacterized protein (DUF736 family)